MGKLQIYKISYSDIDDLFNIFNLLEIENASTYGYFYSLSGVLQGLLHSQLVYAPRRGEISHLLRKMYAITYSVSLHINNHFPQLKVVGNSIPKHLQPLNGTEVKFYNSKTKKYVNFPGIGAF